MGGDEREQGSIPAVQVWMRRKELREGGGTVYCAKGNREDFLPVFIDTRLGGDSALPCRLGVTARTGCPLVHWDLVQTDSLWRDGSSLGSWQEDRNAGSSG